MCASVCDVRAYTYLGGLDILELIEHLLVQHLRHQTLMLLTQSGLLIESQVLEVRCVLEYIVYIV
jgi:hypothetical protein